MVELPALHLDHINIPAKNPVWLADWYADNLGFKSQEGFVFGAGTYIVFEEGEPLNYQQRVHFGFRCSSKDAVMSWAEKFSTHVEEKEFYCAFKTADPEGNWFEVYWENDPS